MEGGCRICWFGVCICLEKRRRGEIFSFLILFNSIGSFLSLVWNPFLFFTRKGGEQVSIFSSFQCLFHFPLNLGHVGGWV